MVRSFHHAARAGLSQHVERGNVHQPQFESWVRYWSDGVSAVFLKAYFQRLGKSDLIPIGETELRAMLQAYLLNQMLAELNDELSAGSGKLKILLQDIFHLLGDPADRAALKAAAHPTKPAT